MAATAPTKPFEVNPWFRYYVARDGLRDALVEAINVDREYMTTPGPDCKTCGKPTWHRPLVGAYQCPTCQPGLHSFE